MLFCKKNRILSRDPVPVKVKIMLFVCTNWKEQIEVKYVHFLYISRGGYPPSPPPPDNNYSNIEK
jgi:hypothetical protein